jgi:dTDP-3,4-didehydro-2,6-dideoxy-alpha-D-glucose 3-reductase
MNVLLLGMSDIAVRRIVPALQLTDGVTGIDVASRRGVTGPAGLRRVYGDYATALAESDAELVYISLVNSLHREWAERSLLSGRHTIIDKPACLNHRDTLDLATIAEQRTLCLAEGIVFHYHPQFRLLQRLSDEHGPITRVNATFSIPPLPAGNFRNDPALGGGALADLGPYAAGAARLHFRSAPRHCTCRILSRHPATGVDTAFAVNLEFDDGRSLVGHFGFDTQYQNRLIGYGPAWGYHLNRAFTTPPEAINQLEVAVGNQARTLQAEPGDAFTLFFAEVFRAIRDRQWDRFRTEMIADSALRKELRMSSLGEAT